MCDKRSDGRIVLSRPMCADANRSIVFNSRRRRRRRHFIVNCRRGEVADIVPNRLLCGAKGKKNTDFTHVTVTCII